jgi:hypothetical protein
MQVQLIMHAHAIIGTLWSAPLLVMFATSCVDSRLPEPRNIIENPAYRLAV